MNWWKMQQTAATFFIVLEYYKQHTPWPESARELYRPGDCRWSAKLAPTFVDSVFSVF
jgi:hypothetical protein